MDDFGETSFFGFSGIESPHPLTDGWQNQAFLGSSGEDGESSNPPPSSTEESSEADYDNQQPVSPEEEMVEPPNPDFVARNGGQSEIIENVKNILHQGKNLLLECPPGCDRRTTELKVILNYWQWIKHGMPFEGEENLDRTTAPVPSKIFVVTRSFQESQKVLQEIKDELGTTQLLWNVKISVLDHRKNLCLNEAVTGNDASAAAINLACRKCVRQCNRNIPSSSKKSRDDEPEGPGCTYYENSMQSSANPLPFVVDSEFGHQVHDIEDFKQHCRETSRCPYFDVRHLARNADLVICPIEFILSPVLRLEYEIKLNQAIVLIDDGYNLEDLCRNEATVKMTLADLSKACAFIDKLNQDFQTRGVEEDFGFSNVHEFLVPFFRWIIAKSRNDSLPEADDILERLQTLDVTVINYEELLKLLVESAERVALAIADTDAETVDKVLKFISSLCLLLTNMPVDRKSKSFFVEVRTQGAESNPNRPDTVLHLICADPSIIMKPVDNATNSIIVSSSCLAPYQPFETEFGEFGISFGEPVKILPDPCFRNRLQVFYTDRGPNNVEFVLNFRSRKDPKVIRETGCALLELCKIIPNGKLALFNSEDHFKTTWKHWQEKPIEQGRGTIIDEIRSVTRVFCELDMRTETDTERLMTEFQQAARSRDGAVLLALVRGKLIENWDLHYNNVRGVVHIAMPFGPFWHPNIVAKRVFLGNKYDDDQSPEILLHYHKEAFRRENRSFCCCIRDIAKDHGVVVVLDSRMEMESHAFEDTMPSWINTPRNCPNFDYLVTKVREKVRQFPSDN